MQTETIEQIFFVTFTNQIDNPYYSNQIRLKSFYCCKFFLLFLFSELSPDWITWLLGHILWRCARARGTWARNPNNSITYIEIDLKLYYRKIQPTLLFKLQSRGTNWYIRTYIASYYINSNDNKAIKRIFTFLGTLN